jgi:hypothetical protein
MISVDIFSGLAPFVQLVFVVSAFTLIFLIAYNRTAATNLTTFFRELYAIHRQGKHIEATDSVNPPNPSEESNDRAR